MEERNREIGDEILRREENLIDTQKLVRVGKMKKIKKNSRFHE